MTKAAHELHLTQSGVSQHMQTLEEAIGIKLFDRVAQRIVPTAEATALFERCTKGLQEIELAIAEIKGESQELRGQIRIGMPIEFGNNVIMPLVAKFAQAHPRVGFSFELGFASAMNELLLKGELDFAFIDEFPMDRSIQVEPIYDETLELCISSEALKKKSSPKNDRNFYESLEYVEYQKDEPLLRRWFAHHVGSKNLALDIRATVMDVQGIARLIVNGVGAGVLPSHLVTTLQKNGLKLTKLKGSGKPLQNRISLVHLRDRSHSPQALAALNELREVLKKH